MSSPNSDDPCPCGSGKNHQNCCLGKSAAVRETPNRETLAQTENQHLQSAVQQHQAGRLQQAGDIYRQILWKNPGHPDALHLLGTLFHQTGNNEMAVELISRAIRSAPSNPFFHDNLGTVYQVLNRLDDAANCYLKVLALAPDYAGAHFNLGNVLKIRGQLDEAAACYQKALALRPDYVDAYINLGNTLKELGKLGEAMSCYQKILTFDPNFAEVHFNLGIVLQEQGKLDEAVACYRRALALKADYAEAHSNLGGALREQGNLDGAVVSYRRAISLKPDYAEAHSNLGDALREQGKLDEAVDSYHRALALKPEYFDAYGNLSQTLTEQGKQDEAIAYLQQALSLEPTHFEWQLRILCSLTPSMTFTHSQISTLRSRLEIETERLLAQEGSIHTLENVSFKLFGLAYHGADDKPIMEQVSRLIRAKAPALNKSLVRQSSPTSVDKRIRVGFISSLFYNHTISKLTQGYIRNLDRSRFHVTVIHARGGKNDPIRSAINGMADAVVLLPYRLESAQQLVADLALDVLHYPDIGMSPYTYFLAYTRLAPVQSVSWGHPVTTGLDTVDYFLSFGAAEPEGAENHYTETLVRFNRVPTYYEPFVKPAQIGSRPALGLPETGHLYGCLQTLFKFHPDFDAVLADIIARDPLGWIIVIEDKSRLLRDQLCKRWSIPYPTLLERVIFLPLQPSERFMMLLSHMDVQLDPPHFGSGNTIYESMVYGIPIITWPGDFMRGRLVAGVYKWLGVTDAPVAATLDDYAPLAVAFATDRDRCDALKQQLIAKSSALYQDELAVRELEAFFEQAVAASRRGEKLSRWFSGFPYPAR